MERQYQSFEDNTLAADDVAAIIAVYGFCQTYCGWVLARAHARSGNPKLISEYLGGGDRFDESIADFAEAYADQNDKDYQEFVQAVRKHRVQALIQ